MRLKGHSIMFLPSRWLSRIRILGLGGGAEHINAYVFDSEVVYYQ
jgi:hypothetical protein